MVRLSEMVEGVADRLDKLGHLPDLLLKGGLAYAGYRATGNVGGAITALVGLRLAEGHNLAGGAAGVTALALIGLGNAFGDMQVDIAPAMGIPQPPQVYVPTASVKPRVISPF